MLKMAADIFSVGYFKMESNSQVEPMLLLLSYYYETHICISFYFSILGLVILLYFCHF